MGCIQHADLKRGFYSQQTCLCRPAVESFDPFDIKWHRFILLSCINLCIQSSLISLELKPEHYKSRTEQPRHHLLKSLWTTCMMGAYISNRCRGLQWAVHYELCGSARSAPTWGSRGHVCYVCWVNRKQYNIHIKPFSKLFTTSIYMYTLPNTTQYQ